MEDKRDEITVKKLMGFFEREGKRRYAKDLQTALLYRVNRKHYENVKVEFFECLEDIRQIKSGILVYLNNENKKLLDKKRILGEKIVSDINNLLEESLESPQPIVDKSGEKYQFKDGSQSRFEDYKELENTFVDRILFDKILKLNNIFSDGLAFLGVEEKKLWYRDDSVEEIDPSELEEETKERENNGRRDRQTE